MGETDRGKTGSCSDVEGMFSKSLIQFSVVGKGCVPSLLLNLRPSYGGGNEDNGTSFQRSHALIAGHCSFLLAPDVHKVSFVPSKSLFPQSCVGSGGSMMGLMVILQEGLCFIQVCCTQSPCGRPLLTHTSTVDTQTQFWLSLCGLGMCFVPFPGLSHSGDQVLVPGGPNALITSPANRKLD